jgi:hypothetical protein
VASVVEGGLDSKIVKEFENRKENLEDSLKWWKIWTVCSVILMFISSGFLYIDISNTADVSLATLSKTSLLVPVLIVVWFSFGQYKTHKQLIEQYEFKMSMADSLMGFREILKEDFAEEEQERVGEFVIEAVDRMYSAPVATTGEESQMPNQANLGLLQSLRANN